MGRTDYFRTAAVFTIVLSCLPVRARAEITRLGGTIDAISGSAQTSDAAFYNHVYLVVAAGPELRGQFVATDGTLLGSSFPVPQQPGTQHQPRVAVTTKGDYLVTWLDERFGGPLCVFGRVVKYTDGGPSFVSDDIQIDRGAFDADDRWPAAVASTGAEFLVVWRQTSGDGADRDIHGQRVSSTGALLGDEVAITEDDRWQGEPDVAASSGGYAVVWSSSTPSGEAVQVRQVWGASETSTALYAIQTIAVATSMSMPAIAFDSTDGTYGVVWYQNTSAIYARRYPTTAESPTVIGTGYRELDAIDLSHNRFTGFLAIVHDETGTTAIDIDRHLGVRQTLSPWDESIGPLRPRLAATGTVADWLVVGTQPVRGIVAQRVHSNIYDCLPLLSMTEVRFWYGGSSVRTPEFRVDLDCVWEASSSASWVRATPVKIVAGYWYIVYTADPNTGYTRRTATITVGAQTVTATQAPVSLYGVMVWHNPAERAVEAWTVALEANETLARTGTMPIARPSPGPRWNLAAVDDTGQTTEGVGSVLIWQHLDTGEVRAWSMEGIDFVSERVMLPAGYPDLQVVGGGYVSYTSFTKKELQLILQNRVTGDIWAAAYINGQIVWNPFTPSRVADTSWKIVAAQYDPHTSNGRLYWQHLRTGYLMYWSMQGTTRSSSGYMNPDRLSDPNWRVVEPLGYMGILLRHRLTGQLATFGGPMTPSWRSFDWQLPGQRYDEPQAQPDIDGDGKPDLLLHNMWTGHLEAWLMNGVTRGEAVPLSTYEGQPWWRVAAVGDMNGDGRPDLLWQHADGYLGAWLMNRENWLAFLWLSPVQEPDSNWRVAALYDVNGDGGNDIVWQNYADGTMRVWYMDGTTRTGIGTFAVDRSNDPGWRIVGTGDVNRDGRLDLLWWHAYDGRLQVWYMEGLTRLGREDLSPDRANTDWRVVGVGDFNRDGSPDLVWQHRDGGLTVWYMNGVTLFDSVWVSPTATAAGWRVAGVK